MAGSTIIGYTALEVISAGFGGVMVTVISGLVLKGIKHSRNGAKPASSLTMEVGKLSGNVESLEKRHVELKADLTIDIGKVEQAVKDQAESTSVSIGGVHQRIDDMSDVLIKEIRNGHGKTD